MIASGKILRSLQSTHAILAPFDERTTHASGLTFGLGPAGYDIRVAEDHFLAPGEFCLANALEQFRMPNFLLGIVHDKSTWAREGLALQNTVIEPGWRGNLMLELSNHGKQTFRIGDGMPIAQVVFHFLDQPAEAYAGRYQDQQKDQGAIWPVEKLENSDEEPSLKFFCNCGRFDGRSNRLTKEGKPACLQCGGEI